MTTHSQEGLLHLIPVYLDHILNPIITADSFSKEVFSVDSISNAPCGVVYCEMKSRQYSEADQIDLKLRHKIFCGDDLMEAYRWEFGGLVENICKLSVEQVIQYHQKFYCEENIFILLCGPDVFSWPLDFLDSKFMNRKSLDVIDCLFPNAQNIPSLLEQEGRFPSDDESLGSIGFGWIGPPYKDLFTIFSLHILFKALVESSASLLYQEFVERPNPIATDIDYEIKPFRKTLIELIFSGVPNYQNGRPSPILHNSGYFKNMLKKFLISSVSKWKKFQKLIEMAIKSFELRLLEQFEEDPCELIQIYCIPELILGLDVGESLLYIFQILSELKSKDEEYWKSLLFQYIINNNCEEVRMIPDPKMAQEIKLEEIKRISQNSIDYNRSCNTNSTFSKELNCYEKPSIKIPEFILSTDFNFINSIKDYRLHQIQIVKQPSIINYVSICLKITDIVESHLWSYIPLFQESIFQNEVILPAGVSDHILFNDRKIAYQELQLLLNTNMTSYGISLGFGNNPFSSLCLDSYLILTGSAPTFLTNSNQLLTTLLNILIFTFFSKNRLSEIIENLYNRLIETCKSPYEILDTMYVDYIHRSNINYIRVDFSTLMFHQQKMLKKFRKNIKDTLIAMNLFKKQLLNGLNKGTIVHLSTAETDIKDIESQIRKLILSESKSFGNLEQEMNEFVQILPRSVDYKIFGNKEILIYPLSDATSGFLNAVVKIPESISLSQDKFVWIELELICYMISFTEGPLYHAIRGSGLAYDSSLMVSFWEGTITFTLNDSVNIVKGFQTFLDLVSYILDFNSETINDEILSIAKSRYQFQYVCDRSTPSSIASNAFKCALQVLVFNNH